MKSKYMASLLLLSVVSTSYAKEIYSKGDWTLDDKTADKKNPGSVCIAYTYAEAGNAEYYLVFSRVKNQKTPVEVYIQQTGKAALAVRAELKDGSTLSFANSGKKDKADILWNIPQNTQALVDQLVAKKDVQIKPADGSRDVRLEFSASGFDKVLQRMQEKCLANDSLADKSFEEAFVNRKDFINPVGITPANIVEMKRLLQEAYPVHLNVKGNEAEMNKLRARYKVQLDEASSLNALVDRLGSREIPAAIKAGQDNDQLEAAKKAELAQVTKDIVVQRQQVQTAQNSYNAARNAIAPYEQEHESRANAAEGAQSRVQQDAARINDIQNRISSARGRIAVLNQEVGSLNESTRRAQLDLRNAQAELVRADRNFRAYNPKVETARILNSDRTYNEANKELSVIQNQLNVLERAVNDTHAKVIAREAELRACQGRTVTSISHLLRDIAQARPEQTRPRRERPTDGTTRPGRDSGSSTSTSTPSTSAPAPSTTTTSTPAPVPECTSQKEALRLAQVAEADVQNQLNTMRNRVQDARSRREMAERRAETEVQRQSGILNRELEQASRRVDSIQSVVAQNEKRSYQINSVELPSLSNNLRSLENELPQAQAQYNQDSSIASRSNQDLGTYERQVGWNQKVNHLNNATQTLQNSQQALANSETIKRNDETIIANCQSSRIRISNDLIAKQQQKAQAEARLSELNVALQPFETERAKIEGIGSGYKNQLAGLAVEFEGQLPK
jgi:hypothetical protein